MEEKEEKRWVGEKVVNREGGEGGEGDMHAKLLRLSS